MTPCPFFSLVEEVQAQLVLGEFLFACLHQNELELCARCSATHSGESQESAFTRARPSGWGETFRCDVLELLLVHSAAARANYRVVEPDAAQEFCLGHDAAVWRCFITFTQIEESQPPDVRDTVTFQAVSQCRAELTERWGSSHRHGTPLHTASDLQHGSLKTRNQRMAI